MHYFVSKIQHEGNILNLKYDNTYGYIVTPKNKIADAIFVNKMTIMKLDFIKNILKKKVRLMLENLDNESDSDDNRKALDDVQRYRYLINEKYSKFLDSKYLSLLNQKIDILEREFKNNLIEQNIKAKKDEIYFQEQYSLEEKEQSRRR